MLLVHEKVVQGIRKEVIDVQNIKFVQRWSLSALNIIHEELNEMLLQCKNVNKQLYSSSETNTSKPKSFWPHWIVGLYTLFHRSKQALGDNQ